MRNFLTNLKNSFYRFMYGRNGTDQLNQALLFVYIALWLVGTVLAALTGSQLVASIVNILSAVLALILLWRTFSRRLDKRRRENARFLQWWNPIRRKAMARTARRKDKAHKYFTCKACGAICRVPVGKGKIEITCPKCHGTIQGKS